VEYLTDLLASVLLWPSPRLPHLRRLLFYEEQCNTHSTFFTSPLLVVFKTLPQIYRYPTNPFAVLITTSSQQTLLSNDRRKLITRDILSIQNQRVIHLIQDLYDINQEMVITLFDLALSYLERKYLAATYM
jgi:hypothetical protein